MIIVGCDAGKKGGFGVFKDGDLITSFPMPLDSRGEIDLGTLSDLLAGYTIDETGCRFLIEEQYVPAGQGHSKEIFTNFGIVYGLAHAYFDYCDTVSAKKWKTALSLVSKGAIKKTKQHAVTYCNNKFDTDFTLKTDGIAEGVLIGWYWHLINKPR